MTGMGAAAVWGVFLAAAAGTLVLRWSFIGALGNPNSIPGWARRALHLVPAAVLAALILPAVLRPRGPVDLWNERALAAAIAAVVAWRTRSTLATLIVGMGTLWLLQAFG